MYAPFFSTLGCFAAITLSSLGAAYGTAKSSIGIISTGTIRPDTIIRALLPIIFSAILSIYGLVVSVMIANGMGFPTHIYKGFIDMGAGLAVGISCIAAGMAIGITGDAGARGVGMQPRLYTGWMLIQIFGEVLGLYGMIIALIMLTKGNGVSC